MYGKVFSRGAFELFNSEQWTANYTTEAKDALRAVLLVILFLFTFGSGMVS